MTKLKRNLIANYLGQAWGTAIGIVFVPIYIKYLGIEAYGLIGIFTLIQSWMMLLDLGMTPTLNREMARFTAGAHSAQSIHDLLRSIEYVVAIVSAGIFISLFLSADFLARDWFKVEKLTVQTVAQAFTAMSLVIALRFAEGVYRGALFGLQRHVWLNGTSALLATVRHVGAVAVLAFIDPTIYAFFVWQGLNSFASFAIYRISVHLALPRAPSRPCFSRAHLLRVSKFAGGVLGISLLGLLLTQVDKLILSRMLPMASFGYYTLAATVVGIVYMLVGPITQAISPRMVELSHLADKAPLASLYHLGSQLVTVLTAPCALILCFFPEGVIFMWSGDMTLSHRAAPVLSVLVLGTFLHGLMSMPYQLQLAHGWTSLTLKTNVVAVCGLIPAMILAVPRYGALGAAWIWVALNVGYILIAIQLMHRKILQAEKWHWYLDDVLSPATAALAVMIVARQIQPPAYQSRIQWLIFLIISGGCSLLAAAFMAARIRKLILARGALILEATLSAYKNRNIY